MTRVVQSFKSTVLQKIENHNLKYKIHSFLPLVMIMKKKLETDREATWYPEQNTKYLHKSMYM